jgi:FAD:protein FMN transferase
VAAPAKALVQAVADCAWRIEDKFSRYRPGNIVYAINTSGGAAVTVDEETANLLDFATKLTELSQGRFDITSGVLRCAWTFDGGSCVPMQAQIDELLSASAGTGWTGTGRY